MKNFLVTLFVSQGVPMLLSGDERGRTQRGNNNAYCQDNEISWNSWSTDSRSEELFSFARTLVHLRKEHPVLRRRKFFQGKTIFAGFKDLTWLRPDGGEMTEEAWTNSWIHALGMMLTGDAMDEFNERGERVADDTLLVLLNASPNTVRFTLPKAGSKWEIIVASRGGDARGRVVESAKPFDVEGRSSVVMRQLPGT
jgi:glycogen operon protein